MIDPSLIDGRELSEEARAVLADYVGGKFTASGAAYVLWDQKLVPGVSPSASEVIVWSKQCGLGIPIPPEHEVQEQVRRALDLGKQ